MKASTISNFCAPGAMSYCLAGKDWAKHRLCRYYRKSTLSRACMHFRESMGGHCDCVSAQFEDRPAVALPAHAS